MPTDGLRADDNFEALACLDDRLCLLASDDGAQAAPRTVLLWIRLVRDSRP